MPATGSPLFAAPRFRPERIEPAYEDREAVQALVEGSGPYPNLAGSSGYGGFKMSAMPWFRAVWAADEQLLNGGAAPILHNPRFIEASKRVFGARVVRPFAVIVNLMAPMPAGAPHLDIPTFRGLMRQKTSPWLLSIMGASGLFEPWAVRVSGSVSWFYPGEGAGYECWPGGPKAPSATEAGPFGNVALVGDNDTMFHRVRAIGDPARYDAVGHYGPQSELRFEDGAWRVREGGEERARYSSDEMRVSILWRGLAFEDEAAERVFDEHLDDLDEKRVVEIFLADLERRGIRADPPADPHLDADWVDTLNGAYGFPGFDPERP